MEWNGTGSIVKTLFDRVDTGSIVIFVANAGRLPVDDYKKSRAGEVVENPASISPTDTC